MPKRLKKQKNVKVSIVNRSAHFVLESRHAKYIRLFRVLIYIGKYREYLYRKISYKYNL
jgi:hypothetical protein